MGLNFIKCFFLLLSLCSAKMYAQDSLIVKGTIDPLMNGRFLYLHLDFQYPKVYAESVIKDGKFSFAVPATGLEGYTISQSGKDKSTVRFLSLPGKITMNCPDTLLSNHKFNNNEIQEQYEKMLPSLNRRTYTESEVNKTLISWIEKNSGSPLCSAFIKGWLLDKIPDEEILRLYKLIPEGNKKNSFSRELEYHMENLYVGKTAPDFIQSDTAGVKTRLSTVKGKYILIDFWSSWCVPCRAETPYLVAAMKKYGGKGLQMVSISLDDKRNLWTEAINKDQMTWVNVSDLKGWGNEIARAYRIHSIPRNFLIDAKGKIIAKDLRGTAVMAYLDQLF